MRSRFFLLVALLTVFLGAIPASGTRQARAQSKPDETPPEMSLEEYDGALELLADAVEHLGAKAAEAESLRSNLNRSWIVRAGAERYSISLAWFDAQLSAFVRDPSSRERIRQEILSRIAAMRQQGKALREGGEADRAAAHAALGKILQRSEFTAVHQETWWNRAKARFWGWIDHLLDLIFGRLRKARAGREILVWVVIAAAFGLLAWVGARILLRAAHTEAMRIESPRPSGKTWNAWAQEALRAAAQGDYRRAVHAAYWAGVFRLADLGAWEIVRSRTPREYVRLLEQNVSAPEPDAQERAARAAALVQLTRRLESTWYGFEPATETDFHEAVAQLEILGCRFPSNLATASS